MTTATWTSRVRHDSDATYQEWRDEFITKLGVMVTAGVLAADETNITAGAGARAGTSAEQGYAVYHISDSLHGTAPIYIRFGFGTGTATTRPRIQVTTGTSTNGSGVIGGTALSTIASIVADAAEAADTTYASYLCVKAGFFGISWKQASGSEGSFFLCRTVDSAGAISATGSMVVWGIGSASSYTKIQAFRYASTAVAYSSRTAGAVNGMLGFSPQGPSSTLVGSDIQVFLAWTITPAVAPLLGICGVLIGEVPTATTFSATLVGTTSHTYIALTSAAGIFSQSSGATYPIFAMLWE